MSICIIAVLTVLLVTSVVGGDGGHDQRAEFIKAVTAGDAPNVRKLLSANPSLVHAVDKDGASAILKAAYYRKRDVLDVLLATGVELDIFEAAAVGLTDRVRELIQKDAALANSCAADGFYPLGLAAFFGHKETVKLLLAAGAQVDLASRNRMRVTALHAAAAARQTEIAFMLMERGADVNARQQDDFTPLQEAAATGQLDLINLLLDRGADVNLRSANGKTALRYAVEAGQADAAKLLRSRGALQ
jgi:ankyrin repeat protein